MKKLLLYYLCFFFAAITLKAQTDTTKIKKDSAITSTEQNAEDLLNEVNDLQTDSVALLPNKMPITQRVLWGQRGLMRNLNSFKLSDEERQKELKIRRIMLTTHQVTGFATLAGMVGQAIVGSKLYKNPDSDGIKDTHENLAAAVNGLYFSTAALALFAPPKMVDDKKGYSSIKVHRWLSVIHISSMIATNVLASEAEHNPKMKSYHRAAAFTAFGSLAAAMIIIKF